MKSERWDDALENERKISEYKLTFGVNGTMTFKFQHLMSPLRYKGGFEFLSI